MKKSRNVSYSSCELCDNAIYDEINAEFTCKLTDEVVIFNFVPRRNTCDKYKEVKR